MNLEQALVWNLGTCRSDVKRETQSHYDPTRKSINAEHRGGSIRSSDEVSVMEMERRD